MKGTVVRPITTNLYGKYLGDVAKPRKAKFQYSPTITTPRSFLVGYTFSINDVLYNRGYITLPVQISNPANVLVLAYGGLPILNKHNIADDITEYNYEVIGNNIVFRNNITIDNQTSSGITEALSEKDFISVYTIAYTNQYNYSMYAIRLNDSIYDKGYFELRKKCSNVMAYVIGGLPLAIKMDFDIVSEKYFVFKNNIAVDNTTVLNLTDTLEKYDILSIVELE